MRRVITYILVVGFLALMGIIGIKIIKAKQEKDANTKPPKEYAIVGGETIKRRSISKVYFKQLPYLGEFTKRKVGGLDWLRI